MKTHSFAQRSHLVLALALVLGVFAACGVGHAASPQWNSVADYSGAINPNGPWSYGRLDSVTASAMDLFTVRWGSCGWYLGNAATGSPSIECGAGMWAQNNANGFPCCRWTCPASGNYEISGSFIPDDGRGVDNLVYVVTNGAIMYSSLVDSVSQSVGFMNSAVPLNAGDVVDFTLVWNGGVNMQYGWTEIDATITPSFAHAATASAMEVNGFVVGVTVIDGGYGYTNTPTVRFIGSGGTGAEAIALVTNGVVTGVDILDPGSDYTSAPLVVIDPPYIPNPVLNIMPMTSLTFSNLTSGVDYQLQQWEGYYWSNQLVSFSASNTVDAQLVAGVANTGSYQLAVTPVPAQAFATAQVVNGFVVGITVTSGGSGYVTNPLVTIVGFGSNAAAVATIFDGVVTNVSVTYPGSGYTNTTLVEIALPPIAAVAPAVVLPMIEMNSTNLAPYDNYQVQFAPTLGTGWTDWNGGLFTPSDVTNTQIFPFTNNAGFFRLRYLGE